MKAHGLFAGAASPSCDGLVSVLRLWLLVATLLTLTSIVSPALARQTSADYRDFEKALASELKETNTPGTAVAIVRGDRIVYTKGFGVADVETGAPVTPDMLFRLGSVTKMLTAAALVTLSDHGRIALDKPVGNSVRGLDARLSQLTPHQLLSHSAGLIDFGHTCCAQDESTFAAEIRGARDTQYFFTEPGKVFSYSNPGYHIAGYIIQELTGLRYADAMDSLLFKPLGMAHTTFRPTTAMTFPLAQGHDPAGAGKPTVLRPFVNNVGDWPSGFAFTNVTDLARFVIALMNGGRIDGRQVLPPSLLAVLSKPHVDVPSGWDAAAAFLENAKYGHGFFIQEHRGIHLVHHIGVIDGFGAFVVLAPEQRLGIIILANKTGAVLLQSMERALELSLPLKPRSEGTRMQAMAMSSTEMESYSGTYVNGAHRIVLHRKDGKLFCRQSYPTTVEEGPGYDFEAPVTKVGANRFVFITSTDTTKFVLISDGRGRPEYLHSNFEAARRVEP